VLNAYTLIEPQNVINYIGGTYLKPMFSWALCSVLFDYTCPWVTIQSIFVCYRPVHACFLGLYFASCFWIIHWFWL